jgi:hypothetical protein
MANSPNIPTNVSSLVSPDILFNLKSSQSVKAFGDQIKDTTKQKIITAAAQSTLARLYEEKAALIKEGIEAEITHSKTLLQLEKQKTPGKKIENGKTVETPPQISEEEYILLVGIENINYAAFQENLQKRKDENQKAIDTFLKDPFAKIKEKKKKQKEARAKAKSRTKAEKRKAKQEKRKAVLKSAKSLVPVLTLLLTDKISEIIAQNDTIKKLVDDTNRIITEANESGDQAKLDNAKVVRDSALRVIQSNEDKINKINEQLQRVSLYINLFNTIVNIIGPIVLPTPIPTPIDVVTIPKENFRRKVFEPALKVLNVLIALLPTISVSLEKAVQILQDYKAQLLNINGTLDNLASPTLVNKGTDYGTYKGFKFALREETGPRAVTVGENKRHYAVAINKQNIEQLKSELSFTLDPNDLIEQLKLVIDQQNLQG